MHFIYGKCITSVGKNLLFSVYITGLIHSFHTYPPDNVSEEGWCGGKRSSAAPYLAVFTKPRPLLRDPIKCVGFDLNPSWN